MLKIDRTAAFEIAKCKVDEYARLDTAEYEIVLDHTMDWKYGWVFFYNASSFLRTGNYIYALGGNAPLLVLFDGRLLELSTAIPVERALSELSIPD